MHAQGDFNESYGYGYAWLGGNLTPVTVKHPYFNHTLLTTHKGTCFIHTRSVLLKK